MKFRVQNLFLEDIHLILFLPKISWASTKLSTQLSETVEEPFSSDITRTHRYNSAILNNVARSSALGTTLRDVCVVCVVCVSMSTGSVFVTRHFQNLGKNAKQADTKHLQSIHILSREGLLIKSYWLVFFNVGQSLFPPPRYFLKRFCIVLKWF